MSQRTRDPWGIVATFGILDTVSAEETATAARCRRRTWRERP
jgi:hypothetical protein